MTNPSGAVLPTGGSATATALLQSARATIIDDDATPRITVSDNDTVCEPDTGTAALIFTITRVGPSNLTSVVGYSTVDGTAKSTNTADGNDFVATSGSVTFAPGETEKTVTITVNGDLVYETDETFTLQITSATNATFNPVDGADPSGVGTIKNVCAGGDPAPTFALGPVVQAEGTNGNNPGPFYVRLTRTGLTQLDAQITYSTVFANSTLVAGQAASSLTGGSCGDTVTVGNSQSSSSAVDFLRISGATQNFPAAGFSNNPNPPAQGSNFIDLVVNVCQDATFEPNEIFNMRLDSAINGLLSPTGTTAPVTIVNDDGLAFMIRNPGPEGAEGTTGINPLFNFTIDRMGSSSETSTVCYETGNGPGSNATPAGSGPATAGVDYTGLVAGAANCVTFTPGVMSRNVAVTVIGDTTPELEETFYLRLLSASNGTIPAPGTDDRIATINNDDGPIPPSSGIEGDVVDGSGGPAGDGAVLANDVTIISQMSLGNIAPPVTTPNQFQRADVNIACGNGMIDAGT